MPWTVEDVDRHYRGLADHEKRMWVDVANQQLAEHGDQIPRLRLVPQVPFRRGIELRRCDSIELSQQSTRIRARPKTDLGND
jgi:hypothetical protein